MKRNKESSLLWLLLIPGQLLVSIFFVWIGIRLDFMIFSGGEGGHGIPVFSAIFFVIAAVTIVVLILAVVLTIRGFLRK